MSDELEAAADELLLADARRECCRACGGLGAPTGVVAHVEQPHVDSGGRRLVIAWPQLECPAGHAWWAGAGMPRGLTSGSSPVLLEDHLRDRRSREVYAAAGVVDSSIASGMYWRSHPDGRSCSTQAQRASRRSRAGWYA